MSKSSPSSAATSSPKPVYALVGSDPFLQLEALRDILASLDPATQRTDFEGDRAELVHVLDELRSFSMFSSSKVVVVRDADDFISKYREKLEDFLTAVSEGKETMTGTLILRVASLPANQRIAKVIIKLGELLKCDPPPLKDVPDWISRRVRSHHRAEIEPAAAKQLADLIGDDLGRLDTELAKLAIQADGGKITSDDVSKSVSFQREQEIWEITTLLGRGKSAEAVKRWRDLIRTDPSAEFRMLTWLGIWLENCRTIVKAKESGDPPLAVVQKQVRIWDNNAWKDFVQTATRLGKSGIAARWAAITDIDRRIKSGLGEAADNIERFLATTMEE